MKAFHEPTASTPVRALSMTPQRCRVLVAEHDAETATSIVGALRVAGFEVDLATTGPQALSFSLVGNFELLVLDLMLPEPSGESVLAHVRACSAMPVIVLSGHNTLADRLRSFELGATDYLPKPFWVEELVARVRARLPEAPRTLAFDDIVVDRSSRNVTVAGIDARLTPLELEILVVLLDHPRVAISRIELAKTLSVANVSDRTVDSHIARLRRKLGPAGQRISTVWGHGYRFDGTVNHGGRRPGTKAVARR